MMFTHQSNYGDRSFIPANPLLFCSGKAVSKRRFVEETLHNHRVHTGTLAWSKPKSYMTLGARFSREHFLNVTAVDHERRRWQC
jgi:hypothetical protein